MWSIFCRLSSALTTAPLSASLLQCRNTEGLAAERAEYLDGAALEPVADRDASRLETGVERKREADEMLTASEDRAHQRAGAFPGGPACAAAPTFPQQGATSVAA